jgi:hypothetical protein
MNNPVDLQQKLNSTTQSVIILISDPRIPSVSIQESTVAMVLHRKQPITRLYENPQNGL